MFYKLPFFKRSVFLLLFFLKTFFVFAEDKKIDLTSSVNFIDERRLFTYNGLTPGPIIRAEKVDRLYIHFTNNLKDSTSLYLHGLLGKNRLKIVSPYEKKDYILNLDNSGIFWYHPYYQNLNQLQMGLYGAIIVEDDKIKIPSDKQEIIFLNNINIDQNNQLIPLVSSLKIDKKKCNIFIFNKWQRAV